MPSCPKGLIQILANLLTKPFVFYYFANCILQSCINKNYYYIIIIKLFHGRQTGIWPVNRFGLPSEKIVVKQSTCGLPFIDSDWLSSDYSKKKQKATKCHLIQRPCALFEKKYSSARCCMIIFLRLH